MPQVHPEELGDQELARIYMTPKLAEAQVAEDVLTEHGITYFVLAEPWGRTLFGSPRNLATFYVAAEQAESCAAVLIAAGLGRGVVRKDD